MAHLTASPERTRWRTWLTCCLLCHRMGQGYLCETCTAQLPLMPDHRCPLCGVVRAASHLPSLCGPCTRNPPPYQSLWVGYTYHCPIQRLIHRLKFHGQAHWGRCLMEPFLRRYPHPPRAQALVPMPVSTRRLQERGYNQVAHCVQWASRAWGLPIAPACTLQRVRHAASQARMTPTQRQRNVHQAFCAHPPAALRTVVLWDDVYTTGATLRAAAQALTQRGITVHACVLAKA